MADEKDEYDSHKDDREVVLLLPASRGLGLDGRVSREGGLAMVAVLDVLVNLKITKIALFLDILLNGFVQQCTMHFHLTCQWHLSEMIMLLFSCCTKSYF